MVRTSKLFNGLLLLSKGDGAKEVRRDLQDHVIEEAFVRTLENYSNGTADSVIEGTAAREQLEKDIENQNHPFLRSRQLSRSSFSIIDTHPLKISSTN